MNRPGRIFLDGATVLSLAVFVWTLVAWSAQRDAAYAMISQDVARLGTARVFVPGTPLVAVSDPRFPLVTQVPADVVRFIDLPLGRLPLWVALLVTAALPAHRVVALARARIVHARQRRWWRARNTGLCPACGYDLRATPGRCPECGLAGGLAGYSPRTSVNGRE
jgi:hypothetical protein